MPNVVVTCTFNPPVLSIQGASLRQDTIDALQRALPKHTTTSIPTQRANESPKFLLIGGGEAAAAASPSAGNKYSNWCIDLGQHYCDQKGRSMIFLAVMEALEEEGFAMRGTNTVVTEEEKDVTRMIFSRE